jgi:hypothetical protein
MANWPNSSHRACPCQSKPGKEYQFVVTGPGEATEWQREITSARGGRPLLGKFC